MSFGLTALRTFVIRPVRRKSASARPIYLAPPAAFTIPGMTAHPLLGLCDTPTAPFVEHHVVAFIEQFVALRPRLSRDETGNLLIELKGTGSAALPRWVFTAHMDHPGFIAREMLDKQTLQARFHGWVLAEFFKGQRVRFFDGEHETTGEVLDF